MKEKRCIFHIPNYIDKTSKSGSSVRPQMMIKAFEEIGYHVDYVYYLKLYLSALSLLPNIEHTLPCLLRLKEKKENHRLKK